MQAVSHRILIAHNDGDTRGLLAGWLHDAGYECTVSRTDAAVAQAQVQGPDVALLSVTAAHGEPMQVARTLASRPEGAPVIVVSQPCVEIAVEAARAGAVECLPWPTSQAGVLDAVRRAVAERRSAITARRLSARMREEIARAARDLTALIASADPDDVPAMLGAMLEARLPDAADHGARVAEGAATLARTLGVPAAEVQIIRRAALLHDAGKLAMPARLLSGPARPTNADVEALRLHPALAESFLAGVPALAPAAPLVSGMHERVDGSGYPLGLQGESIPYGARILAVADAFDVMTSARAWRDPLLPQDANTELVRLSGSQLDPDVVRGWIRMTESHPCS